VAFGIEEQRSGTALSKRKPPVPNTGGFGPDIRQGTLAARWAEGPLCRSLCENEA